MEDTDLIAFLDESRKPMRNPATRRLEDTGLHHYVVAAVVVFHGDIPNIRRQLLRIRGRVGYLLHYQKLKSLRRRVEVVKEIEEIDEWDCYIFETARALFGANVSEHHVRAKTIGLAFSRLSSLGILRAVLETRADPKKGFNLDQKDHQVLNKLKQQGVVPADFQISHADKTESLLQLSDVLAGARSDSICNSHPEPYARISHRVRHTYSVFTKRRS